MLARVSNIEAFRQWKHWTPLNDDDVEPSIADLVRRITQHEPTEPMRLGTAFHKALELAFAGDVEVLRADGYTFHLAGGEVVVPEVRELRLSKVYGGLTVTGKADGLLGLTVVDHKATKKLDAERYLDGYAWRFYLDIFGCDFFQWNVFEVKPDRNDPRVVHVGEPQTLSAYRYPGLASDCADLAAEYLEFARANLPADFNPIEGEDD
jgi:hypothetical protein